MNQMNDSERDELIRLLQAGESIPEQWRSKLFPGTSQAAEIGKEYRLVYEGKMKREEVLAQTPAAPWQLEREFCTERPHSDGWRNLLVWGDNLLALRGLLADQQGPNHFGTRGKIKLIYIDPPFATRQDFMKDKEKAYRDKVFGAQFIEFIRRRLILLRELLADEGSIYVHLDFKKGHYLKAVLDEVFGEENFQNEIVWRRSLPHNDPKKFGAIHDTIFWYSRSDTFSFRPQHTGLSDTYIRSHYNQIDETGRRFQLTSLAATGPGPARRFGDKLLNPPPGNHWRYTQDKIDELLAAGRIVFTSKGKPRYVRYMDEMQGPALQSIWTDIRAVNSQAAERVDYPTQKPEQLIERIIRTSSDEGDIVLDCFAGSGTTAAVAEKLGRRWIAMDCGKLAIYTVQRRLFSLTTAIGASKKDDRIESERVEDWAEKLKSTPGVLLITEKARKGECEVTLDLLHDLSALIKTHKLLKKDASVSLVCPEAKLLIPEEELEDAEEGTDKRIEIEGIEFRISVIAPKNKPEKEQPLPVKTFAQYRAGVYDMDAIRALPWDSYRPFVLKLFGVREHLHQRYGLALDGYIGTHSALLWNYPDHKTLTLDHGYVDDLHRTLRGKAGERFYVIAPVMAMAFAEDEVVRGAATYVFLKVPLSVLLRLIEKGEPAALRQPSKEEDVNEVIDAVGFDFISQPKVEWIAKKEKPKDELFHDYVLELTEFRAQTLATDPEDFANFETFSMAMVDLDYDGDVFHLSRVYWGEDLIKAADGLENAERLALRIPESEFAGEQMMVILCDRYGNEKRLLLSKSDFEGKVGQSRRTLPKLAAKSSAKKNKGSQK